MDTLACLGCAEGSDRHRYLRCCVRGTNVRAFGTAFALWMLSVIRLLFKGIAELRSGGSLVDRLGVWSSFMPTRLRRQHVLLVVPQDLPRRKRIISRVKHRE